MTRVQYCNESLELLPTYSKSGKPQGHEDQTERKDEPRSTAHDDAPSADEDNNATTNNNDPNSARATTAIADRDDIPNLEAGATVDATQNAIQQTKSTRTQDALCISAKVVYIILLLLAWIFCTSSRSIQRTLCGSTFEHRNAGGKALVNAIILLCVRQLLVLIAGDWPHAVAVIPERVEELRVNGWPRFAIDRMAEVLAILVLALSTTGKANVEGQECGLHWFMS